MRYHLILASASPRRRELLAQLGVTFQVIPSNIDETPRPAEAPLAYVLRLSQEKAQAVAHALSTHASALPILAADTVVILAADTIGVVPDDSPSLTLEGDILGKPASADEARSMLRRLRGRDHIVCTAFTLLDSATQRKHSQVVLTRVSMRPYSDAEIDAYIATGDPFDKAGSYAIQHQGFSPVAHIDGSHSNVMGLPLDEVRQALQAFAIITN